MTDFPHSASSAETDKPVLASPGEPAPANRPDPPAEPAASAAGDGEIDLLGIRSFFSVALAVLRRTEQLPFHLYVRHYGKGFVPFRFAGTPLSDADRRKLLVRGIGQVFVDIRHHQAFWNYISAQLPAILADESTDALERALVLYQVADRLAEDLSGASDGEAPPAAVPPGPDRDHLVRARALVRLLAGHALHTHVLGDAMEEVIVAESHPGAHLLHVATHGLHLAAGLRMPVNQLAELALGCMMHDAGRFLVGGADDADAEREHPRRCAARLRELAANCPGAIAIAEQHHEQLDGTGFPAGLRAEQIHPWARICALADAYDELVMGAAGQSPLAPAQALERMRQDIGTRFDPDLFELFTEQVKLRPGPSRLGADRPLRGAMPMPLAPGGRKADRRQFPRFPFRKPVVVRSADGQPTGRGDPARAIDLSRGGIHLVSERPYVAGQSIRVWIPSETGGSKQLVAKVMHCRPLAPGEGYAIGARFIRV